MLTKLLSILEKTINISDWKVQEITDKGEEYFFVGSSLDMIRQKDVTHYLVTIYKDWKEEGQHFKGSSTFSLHPSMSLLEIKEKCQKGIENAHFVKNSWYPLVEPTQLKNVIKTKGAKLETRTSQSLFKELTEINQEDKNGINSMELFSYEEKKTITNSRGLLVSQIKPIVYLEIITEDSSGKEEVELYFENKFSTLPLGYLSNRIQTMILQTKDRSDAILVPNLGNHPIILSSTSAANFFDYYVSKSSAKAFYEKLTPFKPGDSLQGDKISGDMVEMWLDPQLEGSYHYDLFDEEGYPLEKLKIIEGGKLIRYWGDIRFSHYIGSNPPTGSLRNIQIKSGSKSCNELKQDPYLEVVSFSDFQMDTMTGNFGGEIRLGYYFNGTSITPVTKGSVVGNILECQNTLSFSKESQTEENVKGPSSILIKNATVSGS